MNQQERDILYAVISTSAWDIIIQKAEEQNRENWEKFVRLPVEQKTSAKAHEIQGRCDAVTDFLEDLELEAKKGRK